MMHRKDREETADRLIAEGHAKAVMVAAIEAYEHLRNALDSHFEPFSTIGFEDAAMEAFKSLHLRIVAYPGIAQQFPEGVLPDNVVPFPSWPASTSDDKHDREP